MSKKYLKALLVSGAVCGSLVALEARAQDTSADLSEVVVLNQQELLPGDLLERKARQGILGDKTVMDVPYSLQSLSFKTLEMFDQPGLPLNNVLQNNPSIRASSSSPMYTDFSMRGVNMNGNHMLLNGVPSLFSQFTTPPSHVIERMDITSGPNAGINGVSMSNNGTDSGATPAPGTINVVTKSAPNEALNRFTGVFSGRSSFGGYIDVARRFGSDKSWGVRVNGEYLTGTLSLPGARNKNRDIYINIDHRSAKSATNLFAGYYDLQIDGGQRWFTFSGTGRELPRVPDAKSNYDFPETTKRQDGYLAALNHEYRITDDWSVFANLGLMQKSGFKYNANAALRFDDLGRFVSANTSNAQNEWTRNDYQQIGLRGTIQTGPIKHSIALAADRSFAKYRNDTNNGPTGRIAGDLYNGIAFSGNFYPLPAVRVPIVQWREIIYGLTASDIISIGKFDVLLAASQKRERFLNKLTNPNQKINNNNILPTYGVTFKATPEFSIYYGHTEAFARGSIVANDARYVNRGEILSPAKAYQNEVGAKLQRWGVLTTLALFDMNQQNLLDVPVTATTFRRDADGMNRYKGVELSSVGQLAKGLTVTAGGLYLDAEREKTTGGLTDGRFVNGVSKWSSTVGLEYRPVEMLGLVGRAVYNGQSFIDSGTNGQTRIPSFVAYDVGANVRTEVGGRPIRVSAMVFNATNKDYWMGRGGSTTFGLSMPRTFSLSVSADF